MAWDLRKREDVQQYLDNVATEYRFSCFYEKSPTGCHLLGDFLEAIQSEFNRSERVYKLNCDDNNFVKSCYKYANYRMTGKAGNQDLREAEKYHEKACKSKHPDACSMVGKINFYGGYGEGVAEKNLKKAMKFFGKACDLEHSDACFFLAGLHRMNNDLQKTFEITKRACDLNHIQSCANLAYLYRNGEGVAKNDELADRTELKAKALVCAISPSARPGIVFGDENAPVTILGS